MDISKTHKRYKETWSWTDRWTNGITIIFQKNNGLR